MTPRRTILLVEDNDDDVILMLSALKRGGLANPVQRVRDGEEAVAYLLGKEEFGDREKFAYPSIIISDLKMPRMNGIELLKWLNENPAFRVVPTIMLSTADNASEVSQCYLLGASAYFVKPPMMEGLVEIMKAIAGYWSHARLAQ